MIGASTFRKLLRSARNHPFGSAIASRLLRFLALDKTCPYQVDFCLVEIARGGSGFQMAGCFARWWRGTFTYHDAVYVIVNSVRPVFMRRVFSKRESMRGPRAKQTARELLKFI